MSKLVSADLSTVITIHQTADKKGREMLEEIYGEEIFKPKHPDLIKSYEESCIFKGITPLTIDQFKIFPEDQREYYFNHHQIVTITEALNNGRIPNYDDPNEVRYELCFYMRSKAAGGSGFSYSGCDNGDGLSYVGARLVFFDPEIAKYAASQFLSKYQVIMTPKQVN